MSRYVAWLIKLTYVMNVVSLSAATIQKSITEVVQRKDVDVVVA